MIKTSITRDLPVQERRTFVLGAAACGGCGARSSCDCDQKVQKTPTQSAIPGVL